MGWGAVWEGRSVRGFWEPPWTLEHITVLELRAPLSEGFSPIIAKQTCFGKDGQYVCSVSHQSPGWHQVSTMSPGDKETAFLVVFETPVSQGSVHTWSCEQSSIPAVSNWTSFGRVASPSRRGKTYMGTVRYAEDRSVCNGKDSLLQPLGILPLFCIQCLKHLLNRWIWPI